MKEQIEEIIDKYQHLTAVWNWQDVKADLLKIIPNNDWMEYPKHKPSEDGKYVCYVNEFQIEVGYWTGDGFSLDNTSSEKVRAFKPIPVEPYVKKIGKVEVLLNLQLLLATLDIPSQTQEYYYLILQDIKNQLENGDLK